MSPPSRLARRVVGVNRITVRRLLRLLQAHRLRLGPPLRLPLLLLLSPHLHRLERPLLLLLLLIIPAFCVRTRPTIAPLLLRLLRVRSFPPARSLSFA